MRTIGRLDRRATRIRRVALALIAGAALGACTPDEPDEPPEFGEVEPVAGEPGARIDDVTLPLTEEDIGDTMWASGTAVGRVVPGGFFLRTEGGRVIFVAAPDTAVTIGQTVRAIGPLRTATMAVFEEWERDALQGEIDAEWQLLRMYYIESDSVSVLDAR